MNEANVSAIISATAGISGVILGNSFVAIKEWLKDSKKEEKESAYLAILVVSHLERFANGCLAVAQDDGTSEGLPAGNDNETYHTTVAAPSFEPLDIKVEWKVLPKELMYEIFQISDDKENVDNRISGTEHYSDPPEYFEYFWMRRREYAELGLKVSAIANKLRKHAEMPIKATPPDEWDRDELLKDVVTKISLATSAHEKRQLELLEKINNSV